MKKNLLIFSLFPLLFFASSGHAYSETVKLSQDGGMEIEIVHPDSVLNERTFSISFLIQNNGWESKQNIILKLTNPDDAFTPVAEETIRIEELTSSSSFGTTLDYVVHKDATEGTHFINIDYSQILLSNNVDPMPQTQMNIAIPIEVLNRPEIVIETITPESIFAKSEFSIQATITSSDIDLEDITLEIIAPDIEFRGDTFYKLSSLEKQTPYTISAELITPVENVTTEYTIPVKVILTYTDDLGETNTSTQSMPLLLRPKTFMELTNDGGIWIGDFFIAPYVSIGTIVGIPAGTILSLIIRRSQNKKKESSTK
ncbi:MAG: Uncharacterised protein [Candidatus Nitrosopelagicus brevis]|jgi:hypothetical protein|nr:hypothetical protein [Candidatus Nitrosopelagicus sp.]MEC7707820.1 hypothetical protein [Thermoproteota archaeon]MEC9087529.1 hypothetical protein [Thermoproteota archaeon]MEC9435723.1 hypothetical protein [Thermoproteota archaeon]CAI8177209.1 MAG: Uncharacterised protein [Candidatus Nitrosopelagicus brevis]|tara:strand:+ start:222 stop:1163 length:942 start_codon:yes stop_codon:yes gene_type:complete